jgi:hypothetical protein
VTVNGEEDLEQPERYQKHFDQFDVIVTFVGKSLTGIVCRMRNIHHPKSPLTLE